MEPAFGNHGIERHVMGPRSERWQTLAFKGDADQHWTATAPKAGRKETIIVTGAVAEPIARGVEADQRRQHHVQGLQPDVRAAARFADAVTVQAQCGARIRNQQHAVRDKISDSWQVYAAAALAGQLPERHGADFGIARYVQTDAHAGLEPGGTRQVRTDQAFGSGARSARLRGALRPQFPAQGRSRSGS